MVMASALRRVLLQSSLRTEQVLGAALLRRVPRAPTGHAVPPRGLTTSAAQLIAEVDTALASGRALGKSSDTYQNVLAEVKRLRADNDRIVAEVDAIKEARAQHVAEEEAILEQMRQDGDVRRHGSRIIDGLRKIEEFDFQLVGLRCQQFANSAHVGALKREKVRIEQTEEVLGLVSKVEAALESGQPLEEDGPEATAMMELVRRMQAEYDRLSHAVANLRKDIENTNAKIRSAELTIRVRRDKLGREVDSMRATLFSGFYEMRRKNARVTRLTDMQAEFCNKIAVLERARDKLIRHARVRLLIQGGDAALMEQEVKDLWRDIEHVQKTIHDLEKHQDAHAKQAADAIVLLRRLPDVVTPETGEMRELLIASLREEEFCLARLAVLRGQQALDIRFLADLKAALAR